MGPLNMSRESRRKDDPLVARRNGRSKRLMEHPPPSSSSTFSVDVTGTNPTTDWKYLNEGGATIVFSYVGPEHPNFSGNVLRLRKSPVGAASPSHPPVDEPDDPSVAFQSKVISRLLPSSILPTLHVVSVSPAWLQSLGTAAEQSRPISRRNSDQLDSTRTKGVLTTNLIEPPGLSLEIKVCFSALSFACGEEMLLNSRNGAFFPIPDMSPPSLKRSSLIIVDSACMLACERMQVCISLAISVHSIYIHRMLRE